MGAPPYIASVIAPAYLSILLAAIIAALGGCGPRAGQGLLLAAKSHAGLSGRSEVTFADVKKFVHPVMRHRMGLNFAAVSEGQTTDDIVDMLLKHVPEQASAAASRKAAG